MRNILIILISLLSIRHVAVAQTAREVLDKTAQRLEQSKGASAKFTLTSFTGTTEVSRTDGTIEMQGRKFHLATPEMETWFDGKSQWSMLSESNEVNLQEPTDDELARMNPYAFVAMYRSGYKYRIKKNIVLGDMKTYEVKLTSESKKANLPTIIVNINMQSYDLACIRLKHENDWVRISIRDLRLDKSFAADMFTFPQKKYPKATVIDLR